MTPEQWQDVREQLYAALEVDPSHRSAFVEQIASAHPELRPQLKTLIATYDEMAPDFMAEMTAPSALSEPTYESLLGQQLGSYKIVDHIGSGGMGDVFRAVRVDEQYEKEVAIKLVRAGENSAFVIKRFKSERQILATLDHPNIARLLDGGTTERGVPYVVMELIEGQPIDEFCNHNKLNTEGRLKLFLQVCLAVEYAHQRLIIHRDLKPGNILVTSQGTPKLLDFGIAKILASSTTAARREDTLTGFRLLTPAYASPEQVREETVTTASDVYSLGVVLYELLTLRSPYPITNRTPNEIVRAVCELEPEKPSIVARRETLAAGCDGLPLVREPEKLSKRLAGDLDNIVLMALRKEPRRRYASVEQFAQDIRRHLEELPVAARNDTLRYRASKFVRRNRVGVAAALIVIITLVAGLAVTQREAHIAQRRFNDVRVLANSLIFDIHDSIRDLPGSTPARKLIVEKALQYLDSLAQEVHGDLSLERDLASAYQRVGEVLYHPSVANLGDTAGALRSYRKALAIRDAVSSSRASTVEDKLALARCYYLLARVLSATDDLQGSLENSRKSVSVLEQLREKAPNDPKIVKQLLSSYDVMGDALSSDGNGGGLGRLAEAAEVHQKALALAKDRSGIDPRYLAICLIKVGNDWKQSGNRGQALDAYTQAQDILVRLASDPTKVEPRRDVAGVSSAIGDTLAMNGDGKGAFSAYTQCVEIAKGIATADPLNREAQLDLAVAYDGLGIARLLLRDLRAARSDLQTAREIAARVSSHDPSNTAAQDLMADLDVYIGQADEQSGRHSDALDAYQKALTAFLHVSTTNKTDVQARLGAAATYNRIASVLAKSERFEDSIASYRKSVAFAEEFASLNPANESALYAAADAYAGLGSNFVQLAREERTSSKQSERLAEACSWYQRSLSSWRQIRNPGAMSPNGFFAGDPNEPARELADCDAALAQLKGSRFITEERKMSAK